MNGRSTVMQLLETLDYWTMSLDSGPGVNAIYVDFWKAFDSVPHQRLLRKVSSYGISGNIFKWIKAFLIVNGAESVWANVNNGIFPRQCAGTDLPKDMDHILEDIEITPDMVRKKNNTLEGQQSQWTRWYFYQCPTEMFWVRQTTYNLKPIYSEGVNDPGLERCEYCPKTPPPRTPHPNPPPPPLHKRFQSPTLASNYRPISLSSQVGTILEQILSDHIWDLLHKNYFVRCDQFGFQLGCSCVTQ